MIHSTNVKIAEAVAPQAIKDDAAFTATAIDSDGYNHMTIYCHIGATDIAMAALKVTESDSSGSGYADITGTVVGTAANITGSTSALPSATDDNKFMAFDIALNGSRKRYYKVSATAGDGSAGTFMSAFAVLERKDHGGDSAHDSATLRGCDEILRV